MNDIHASAKRLAHAHFPHGAHAYSTYDLRRTLTDHFKRLQAEQGYRLSRELEAEYLTAYVAAARDIPKTETDR